MAVRTVAAGGGNFNVGATWVGGVAPVANDSIVADATSGNLTLTANTVNLVGANFTGYTRTLALSTFNFTSSGTITLGSGMTITAASNTQGRIQPNSTVTIASNGVKIPIIAGNSGTITLTGTASVGNLLQNGTITGANVILYGTTLNTSSLTLSSPHTLYIKPDTSLTLGAGGFVLMATCPRVIFDTTNVVNTAGPIVVSVAASSIGFLQKPGFNLGTLTQSAIVYQPPTGSTHTLDFFSSGFKLDRVTIQTGDPSFVSSTFNIIGTASFGYVTVVPSTTATPGLSPSTTSFVAQRDVTMDELLVTSEYPKSTTQAGVTIGSAIRNTVRFSAGVTYSISSLNVSGVSVTNGKTTISSMTASVPATLNIGATYSFDNTNITDIDNVSATDYAFAFSNNTLLRTTGITSSLPSGGGAAGGSFTFVS